MAKLPSLRRSDPEPAPDHNRDDRSSVRTEERTARRTRDRTGRRGWIRRRDRSAEFSTKIEEAAEKAAAATRTAAAQAATERGRARPRTSGLAAIGLVVAVIAALAVATGSLAGLGIVIGAVGLLLAFAGLATTGHHYRYLAGRSQAVIALLLSLAAIVVGALALAGSLSWLDTGTNLVGELGEQLPDWLR